MAIRNPWETKSLVFNDFEQKKLAKPFTAKLLDGEGAFSGTGMVFDSHHPTSSYQLGPEWKDRVRPGAFTASLAEHKAAGTMPLMLFMHQRGYIPGVWKSITENKEGLVLEGLVHKLATTPSNVPLLELMKMGAITGLSIGFRPRKVSLDEETKVRDILDVELGEISIVDIPGSSVSRITDVKKDLRGLESVLRQAGLSRREAKALLSQGAKALELEDEVLGVRGGDKVKSPKYRAKAIEADTASQAADEASQHAEKDPTAENHAEAAAKHAVAVKAHEAAASAAADESPTVAENHRMVAAQHEEHSAQHESTADDLKESGGDGGDKEKNPDGINRDDHGRFATKADDQGRENLEGKAGSPADYEAARTLSAAAMKASKAASSSAKNAAEKHAAAADAHRKAAAADAKIDNHEGAKYHTQRGLVHDAKAAAAKGDAQEAEQAEKDAATLDSVRNEKEKNPDGINRDDHGRFANKADDQNREELSTSVVQSIHALRDAVADPSTVQRDADPVTELKRFAQFLKSHLPQE